jgi:hypothetical protein
MISGAFSIEGPLLTTKRGPVWKKNERIAASTAIRPEYRTVRSGRDQPSVAEADPDTDAETSIWTSIDAWTLATMPAAAAI